LSLSARCPGGETQGTLIRTHPDAGEDDRDGANASALAMPDDGLRAEELTATS